MVPFPIVLVDVDYWSGLVDWIVARMLEQSCISEEELELFKLVDSSEEAAQLIPRHIRTSASNEAAELGPFEPKAPGPAHQFLHPHTEYRLLRNIGQGR